jgi:tRNA pseudouridine38-40 synthase
MLPIIFSAMEEKNVKLVIAYDGTDYRGWQYQREGPTIQSTIERCLSKITGDPVSLIASGRTDSGVHALNQVANFKTLSRLPPEVIQKALNSMLPADIFIREASYESPLFHARYHALSKVYEYRILNREEPDIFQRRFLWHIRRPLALPEMAKCLDWLMGTHDFSSFRASGSGNVNPVRTIHAARLIEHGEGFITVGFEADGFLRHMVRNIVGTMVEVGLGAIKPERFKEILEARDRGQAGPTAPPNGLFLMQVNYKKSD